MGGLAIGRRGPSRLWDAGVWGWVPRAHAAGVGARSGSCGGEQWGRPPWGPTVCCFFFFCMCVTLGFVLFFVRVGGAGVLGIAAGAAGGGARGKKGRRRPVGAHRSVGGGGWRLCSLLSSGAGRAAAGGSGEGWGTLARRCRAAPGRQETTRFAHSSTSGLPSHPFRRRLLRTTPHSRQHLGRWRAVQRSRARST